VNILRPKVTNATERITSKPVTNMYTPDDEYPRLDTLLDPVSFLTSSSVSFGMLMAVLLERNPFLDFESSNSEKEKKLHTLL